MARKSPYWFGPIALALALAACTGAAAGGGPGGPGMGMEEGDDWATCDPAQCEDYCRQARCMFDGDLDGRQCRRHCNEYCGNGFFDEDDAEMISCSLAAGVSVICDDTRRCCSENFTSELCGE